MKVKTIIMGVSSLVLLLSLSQPLAKAQNRKRPTPTPKWLKCSPPDNLPDLVITNAVVKKSDYISITIKNNGPCTAPSSRLWISKSHATEKGLKTEIETTQIIPEISAYKSYTLQLYDPYVYGEVHEKKYSIRLSADGPWSIKELDEYNNEYIIKP